MFFSLIKGLLAPSHACGAVLLNDQWALTTSFCALDDQLNLISIGFEYQLEKIYSSKPIEIDQLIPYVDHDDQTKHDLTLIHLTHPINFEQESIRPASICPLDSINFSDPNNNNRPILFGWGSNISSAQDVEILPGGTLKYWYHYPSSKEMKKVTTQVVNNREQDERQFWIEAQDNLLCQGDFGSPVHQIVDGKLN